MKNWEETWERTRKEASNLAFKPNWHLIFQNCPYTVQVRRKLKESFYEERRNGLRQMLGQKDRELELTEYVRDFLKQVESGPDNRRQSMQARKEMFSELLAKDRIGQLTREDIEEILQYSWATIWFTDYPYLTNEVLDKNGFHKLRKELRELLYGTDSLDKRFDNFITNIKGLGAQYVSELLAFYFPEECCVWNRVAADASIFLGIITILPSDVWRYRMKVNGANYIKCCRALQIIKDELGHCGLEKPDFVDVYFFMLLLIEDLKKQLGVLEEIRSFSKQV